MGHGLLHQSDTSGRGSQVSARSQRGRTRSGYLWINRQRNKGARLRPRFFVSLGESKFAATEYCDAFIFVPQGTGDSHRFITKPGSCWGLVALRAGGGNTISVFRGVVPTRWRPEMGFIKLRCYWNGNADPLPQLWDDVGQTLRPQLRRRRRSWTYVLPTLENRLMTA